jgi:hypothetical protein
MAACGVKPQRKSGERNQQSGDRTHAARLCPPGETDDPTFVVLAAQAVLAARAIAPLTRFIGFAPLSLTLGCVDDYANCWSFALLRMTASKRNLTARLGPIPRACRSGWRRSRRGCV